MNLLSFENQIAVKKEYLRRLFLAAGFFLLSTALIVLFFLASLFFSVNLQKKAIGEAISLMQKNLSRQSETEIISLISNINSQVTELNENRKETVGVNRFIKKIIEIKSDGITIESFAASGLGEMKYPNQILLKGRSLTRPELIQFIENLKKERIFSRIESPLSNFLKEKDIDFIITIYLSNYEE